MTNLVISSSDSFQYISNNKIECCVCLENKDNDLCYMPPCKHSWCQNCNEELNKFNINKCPICKIIFYPKLKKVNGFGKIIN